MSEDRPHWHVAGVAGVGMSALAQALAWNGARVTGSDRFFDRGENAAVRACLEAAGIEIAPQDGSAIDASTSALVYSTAVEGGNPEVRRAKELGVPLRHRAEMLAELASGHRVLAVAGTAGKTTTTAMLAHALARLGADPTAVNGGGLVDWTDGGRALGNARRGDPDAPWVLEVDESDRSLLRFSPDYTILTNISQDHFSLDEVVALFREYAGRVRRGIVCDPGVAELLAGATEAQLLTLPAAPRLAADGRWETPWRGQVLRVPQPGEHNAWNALCAAELCFALGFDADAIAAALADFGGVCRRLECVNPGAPVPVYDDYAHNPAKIAAALRTLRETAGDRGRVLAVWRPHGYGPVRSMGDALADAFAGALSPRDALWLLPIFDAGGTADRSVTTAPIADAVRARGRRVASLPGTGAASAALVAREAAPGDAVLVMGARDPSLPGFARAIAADLAAVRES